jgi:hypothetical protein
MDAPEPMTVRLTKDEADALWWLLDALVRGKDAEGDKVTAGKWRAVRNKIEPTSLEK